MRPAPEPHQSHAAISAQTGARSTDCHTTPSDKASSPPAPPAQAASSRCCPDKPAPSAPHSSPDCRLHHYQPAPRRSAPPLKIVYAGKVKNPMKPLPFILLSLLSPATQAAQPVPIIVRVPADTPAADSIYL